MFLLLYILSAKIIFAGDGLVNELVVDKDGIYYSKERRDIPFTGYFTKKKKKGVGKFYNKYRNGKLRILKHYSSLGGNIQTYGEVENNKLNGTWKSYSIRDKLLLSIGNYKNNHLVGMWEHYYPNGRLRFRGNFKQGKPDEKWIFYDKSGTIVSQKIFDLGKIISCIGKC